MDRAGVGTDRQTGTVWHGWQAFPLPLPPITQFPFPYYQTSVPLPLPLPWRGAACLHATHTPACLPCWQRDMGRTGQDRDGIPLPHPDGQTPPPLPLPFLGPHPTHHHTLPFPHIPLPTTYVHTFSAPHLPHSWLEVDSPLPCSPAPLYIDTSAFPLAANQTPPSSGLDPTCIVGGDTSSGIIPHSFCRSFFHSPIYACLALGGWDFAGPLFLHALPVVCGRDRRKNSPFPLPDIPTGWVVADYPTPAPTSMAGRDRMGRRGRLGRHFWHF